MNGHDASHPERPDGAARVDLGAADARAVVSAYLDGELDGPTTRAMDRLVESDAALAAHVAALEQADAIVLEDAHRLAGRAAAELPAGFEGTVLDRIGAASGPIPLRPRRGVGAVTWAGWACTAACLGLLVWTIEFAPTRPMDAGPNLEVAQTGPAAPRTMDDWGASSRLPDRSWTLDDMTNYAPDPGAEVEIVPRRSLELTLSDHQRLAEVASIVAGLLEIEPHDAGAVERLVGRVRSDDLADWLDTRWPAFRSSDRPVLVQVATILRRLAAGELDRHGVVDLKDYVLDHDLHVRIERVRATSSRSRV